MAKDTIVDEVRRSREGLAARHNFDIKAILVATGKRHRKSGHRVVSFIGDILFPVVLLSCLIA